MKPTIWPLTIGIAARIAYNERIANAVERAAAKATGKTDEVLFAVKIMRGQA